jgi:hypothetical protein
MTAPVSVEKLGSQKIAMTAPVSATREGSLYLVSFTMPGKYNLSNLPKPNNQDVFIMEVKPYWAAVIKFSGYLAESKFHAYSSTLKEWAAKNSLDIVGPPVSSQFDPPWKPWFLRHNEIYFEIGRPNGKTD